MPEVKVAVRSYGVRYVCDACGRGEMRAVKGQALVDEGAGKYTWRHECDACGAFANFDITYPTVKSEILRLGEEESKE